MTDWYYHVPGEGRVGPLPAETLRERYRAGRIGRDTLAWHPGVRDWQPLDRFSEDLQLDDGIAAPPPRVATPAPPAFAPVDTAPPPSANDSRDAYSPYAPPQTALAEAVDYSADGEVVYAGFWKRAAALVIDQIVLVVAYYLILLIGMVALGAGAFGLGGGRSAAFGSGMFALLALIYLLYPMLSLLYYAGFESSSTQATLGKMAVGIKVTDDAGRRLGRGRALGRWVSHLLCYLTIYIGYLLAAFTQRKRGLHDMVAGTLVVDRWAYTGQPQRQRRELGTVTVVVLVLGGLGMIAYLGIVFAIAIPAYQSYVQRAAG